MKTHRSTQLFIHCCGGERSVKYVRPALQMETSKEEQRGVVRSLVAEGAGTREIHSRISAVVLRTLYFSDKYDECQKRFRKGRTSLQDDSRRDRPIEPLRLM